MFSNRRKQQKKISTITKKSSSLSITKAHNLNQYYQKIKQKSFQLYLNSGVSQCQKFQQTYTNVISIDLLGEFQQNLIKGFSSIYQLDYRSFQWKDKIQGLLKMGKGVLKVIDRLKKEVGQVNIIKKTLYQEQMEYKRTKDQLLLMKIQSKVMIQNQQQLRNNNEIEHQKIRNELLQKNIEIQQGKKQFYNLRAQNQQLLRENEQLRQKYALLFQNYSKQNIFLRRIRDSSFGQKIIKQMSENVNFTQNQQMKQNKNHIKPVVLQQLIHQQIMQNKFQSQILLNQTLSSCVISFLPPKSICCLFLLTKTSRFFLLKSHKIIFSCYKSIILYKQHQIKYFHRYIEHFQKLCLKIPQQIIQSTFYQYNILKQSIGGDFISVLGSCGNIFQGKFQVMNNEGSRSIREYVQSKQMIHFVQMPKEEQIYLRIQREVVQQFLQERKVKKETIMKQIQSMSNKLLTTQSLYSFDQKTLKQFHLTVFKNFAILFVLSKYLFSQSRNLQHLNSFLLGQLNSTTKLKVQKQYDLQDLTAQLQSLKRMNKFLVQKGNKSEERTLRQGKELDEVRNDMRRLEMILQTEKDKELNSTKQLNQKTEQIKLTKQKCNEIKSLYNQSKQKYNHIINELGLVKETILKLK